MWKAAWLVGAVLCVGLLGAAAVPPRTHLAFVSVQRIAAQTTIGQSSAKRLEAVRQEKSRTVTEKQKQLEALRLEIAQNGGVLYRSKREELKKQEEREQVEFEKLKEAAQADIQRLQREIQTAFQNDLRTAIVELSTQHDADIVLNADTAVVWARNGFDLTDDAVKRMNAIDADRQKK